jgi:hypothetical protein
VGWIVQRREVSAEQAACGKKEADERVQFMRLSRENPSKSDVEVYAMMNQNGAGRDQCP